MFMPIKNFTKNYLYEHILLLFVHNRAKRDPITGNRATVSILNGGGSRAGKTFDIAHVLLTFIENYSDTKNKNAKSLSIIVYRDTLVNARLTYKDFIKCFTLIGLEEYTVDKKGNRIGDYETTNSARVTITFKKCGFEHVIEFKGIPPEGVQPVGCDISFINELVENNNLVSFTGIRRRTEILFLADWNPKESVHWAYNIQRFNTFYTKTTYLDNKHIPDTLITDVEAQCPYNFDDSELYIESYDEMMNPVEVKLDESFSMEIWRAGKYHVKGFLRRRWLKPERPDICDEKDYHLYRMPNEINIANKTANRAEWYTYGEGLNCGQEGAIFKDVTWINSFPDNVDLCYFGLDFGFSNDPSSLVKVGRTGKKLYLKKECYQKTPTSDILFDLIEKPILEDEKRRYIEANGDKWYNKLCELRKELYNLQFYNFKNSEEKYDKISEIKGIISDHKASGLEIQKICVVCDTQDVYKGRGAAEEQQFVIDLNTISVKKGYYWSFVKVGSKPIVPGISLLKKYDMYIVDDDDFRNEQQNYVYIKDSEGNPTNIPDKDSKWCHIWDAVRYAVWKFFKFD